MSIRFSSVLVAHERGSRAFALKAIDLRELDEPGCPITVLDDFRVRGEPFPPHPHAGFSAVTYVFEDSATGLRSRDSLGDDIVVGPGGIVWTEAGSGVVHHEIPADTNRELHGVQIFVNLSAKNKLSAPRMLRLASNEVPEWRSDAGDHVRVAVGSFEGVSSPLVPTEPFTLLDVRLRRAISFDVPHNHYALVYVLTRSILVRADGNQQKVEDGHAIALYGGSGRVTLNPFEPAHVLILSGAAIHEPVLVDGPFIMNERSQIDAAYERYRRGDMGHLAAGLGEITR
jgi:redox-sensitive bicupin YhaK (pirin superfamily)